MRLEQVNTKEKLRVRLYDRRGRTIRANVKKIYHLMRCHQTGRRRLIHWRLIRAMYKISRHFKGKTLKIYSGYRARKVASLQGSYHIKGRAVDFHVAGVSNRTLRDYLRRTFKRGGVGYYPNVPFLHFDVRKQRAFWVDVSGSGESSRYTDAYAYLKRERRAKQTRPPLKPRAVQKPQPAVAVKAVEPPAAEPAPAATGAPPAKPMMPKPAPAPAPTPTPEAEPVPKPAVVEGPPPVGPSPSRSNKPEKDRVGPPAPAKERRGAVSNVRGAP